MSVHLREGSSQIIVSCDVPGLGFPEPLHDSIAHGYGKDGKHLGNTIPYSGMGLVAHLRHFPFR